MERMLETLQPAWDGIRRTAGRMDRKYWIGAGLLLLLVVCFATGDASEAAKKKALDFELSDTAQRVAKLLDREAYAAARGILDAKLPKHPDDAGLHVQYARYLLLTQSIPNPETFESPLFSDENEYFAVAVAQEAGKRAMQLEEKAGPYVAAVLMTTLRDRIAEEFDEGGAVIGGSLFGNATGGVWQPDGFQTSMVNVAWTAIEADPNTAAAFTDDFRKLTERAVELGKVSSAAMLGNLLGDLESKGKDNIRDFELACDAFERALPNYDGPSPGIFDLNFDWVDTNIFFFQRIYTAELAAARKGDTPESFDRLQKALAERDRSLFEKPNSKKKGER